MFHFLEEEKIRNLKRNLNKYRVYFLLITLVIVIDIMIVFLFQNRQTMQIFLLFGGSVLALSLIIISILWFSYYKPTRTYYELCLDATKKKIEIKATILKKETPITREQIEFDVYIVKINQKESRLLLENSEKSELELNKEYLLTIYKEIIFEAEEIYETRSQ